jgi:hypothetical protein
LRASWLPLEKYPSGHCTLLGVLEETLNPRRWSFSAVSNHIGTWQKSSPRCTRLTGS